MMTRSVSRRGTRQKDVAADDGRMEGRYANYFLVGHNAVEFLVDFGQMYPGTQEHFHSRMIMSPRYARELLRVLSESVTVYEEQFGAIGDASEGLLKESSDKV